MRQVRSLMKLRLRIKLARTLSSKAGEITNSDVFTRSVERAAFGVSWILNCRNHPIAVIADVENGEQALRCDGEANDELAVLRLAEPDRTKRCKVLCVAAEENLRD